MTDIGVRYVSRCVVFGLAVALAFPAAAGSNRSRTISGWTVQDRSEQDGGRLVTLAKAGSGWRLEHHFALWHGNGGVYVGATFRWQDCRSGEADALFPWDEPVTAAVLTERTRSYLEECGLTDAQQRRLLAGLEPANEQVQRWIADFRRRAFPDEQ
jgi:hypothetical protein